MVFFIFIIILIEHSVFANSGDPGQMPHFAHLIRVCTVCLIPTTGYHFCCPSMAENVCLSVTLNMVLFYKI